MMPEEMAFVTFVFLLVTTLIFWKVKPHDWKLILLGLATAVTGIAYGSMVAGAAVMMAQTLMKIGFVLVLGGVACSMLPYLGQSDGGKLSESKEADDEQDA